MASDKTITFWALLPWEGALLPAAGLIFAPHSCTVNS